jgi:predicted TIM-barrel fold metal-dependent hydrolase
VGKGECLNDIFQVENSPERLIYMMDKAGIDRTVIMPVRYKDYEKPNMEIAELVSKNPRFIGYARINGADPKSPRLVEQAVKELGLKGIKFNPGEGFPTRELMDKIKELKVPVLGHSGMGISPMVYEALVKSYPEVTFIIAHIGAELDYNIIFTSAMQAIWLAEEFKNVYLDTSANYLQINIERAYKRLGADRLIFGSDGPFYSAAIEKARILDLEISDSDREKILGLNIAEILKL